MPVPSFVTQANIKFDGTTANAVATTPTTVILWDQLSTGDQAILTNVINTYGGVLPLPATASFNAVNFSAPITGTTPTGLDNTLAPTAGTFAVAFAAGTTGTTNTTLSNATTPPQYYMFHLSVDGTTHLVSVAGNAAQTFATLVTAINTSLAGVATAALVGTSIVFTSATTGVLSSVQLVDDLDLFFKLPGFVSYGPTVSGTAPVTYTATIQVDALPPVAVSIVGHTAQTFAALEAALLSAVGATAVASAVGSQLIIASATTGTASVLKIHDGTLFNSLANFVSVAPYVAGVNTLADALSALTSPLGNQTSLALYFSTATVTLLTKPVHQQFAPTTSVYFDGTAWRYYKTNALVGSTPAF